MQLPEYGHTTPTTTPHTRDGGHSGGETPGPIPNPEAKPSSADGTAPERVWESRTPPDIFPVGAIHSDGPDGFLYAYFRFSTALRIFRNSEVLSETLRL